MAVYSLRALVAGVNQPIGDSDSGRLNSLAVGTAADGSPGILTKAMVNLLAELDDVADGSSGADAIGATAISGGSAETVQGILEELQALIVAGSDDQTAAEVDYTQAVVGDWTAAQGSSVKVALDELGAARTVNEAAISSAQGDATQALADASAAQGDATQALADAAAAQGDATQALSDASAAQATADAALPKAGGTMSGPIVMGSSKITGLDDGIDANDAVNKGQLDAAISGIQWRPTVQAFNLIGNLTATLLNGLSPSNGDQYVVTDSGILTSGSVSVVAGDVVEYQDSGSTWVKLVDGVGGFVPDGFRAILAEDAVIAPYSDGSDNDEIIEFDGTTLDGSSLFTGESVDENAILVQDIGHISIFDNLGYVYEGSVASGTWVQFTGAGQINAGNGLEKSGNTFNVLVDGTMLEINGSNQVDIKAGGITNAEINASAAIVESKLSLDYATGTLNTSISNHIADEANPHSVVLSDVVAGSLVANVDVDASAAIAESKLALDYSTSALNTSISDHISDASDAHDASAISVLDTAGDLDATDVEAALVELVGLSNGAFWLGNASGKREEQDFSAEVNSLIAAHSHLEDSAGRHNADQIAVEDAGADFTATDVEGVLVELKGLIDSGSDDQDATEVAYTPTTSADWDSVPTEVGGALDELAQRVDDAEDTLGSHDHDAAYVNVSGDSMDSAANLTFSGDGEVLGLPAIPSADGAAASKKYVDDVRRTAGNGLEDGAGQDLNVKVKATNSGLEVDANGLAAKLSFGLDFHTDYGLKVVALDLAGPGLTENPVGGLGFPELMANVDGTTIEINGSEELQLAAGGIVNSHVSASAAIETSKLADGTELAEAVTFFASTDITAANAEQLIDESNADSLHKHAKLFKEFTNNTGSALAAGSVVALSLSVAGEVILAKADAIATCESVVGVVVSEIADGAAGDVQIAGEATVLKSADFDLGKRVYVSETAGQGTKTAPSASLSVVYLLGGATAAGTVLLQPNMVGLN